MDTTTGFNNWGARAGSESDREAIGEGPYSQPWVVLRNEVK